MVLQRYRALSEGESKQRAAKVGMDIGYELLRKSTLSNYNTQMSKAQIQSLEDQRELDTEFDKNWQNPDEWESRIFTAWWPKHVKKMTEGKSGKALKDINASLLEEKQITLNYIQKRRQQQEKINNQASFDVLKINLSNTDFKDSLQLTKYSKDFLERLDELYKSGDIPELRSEQAIVEQHDKLFSPIVMNFMLTYPDKIEEDGNVLKDYWIEHPNEFVEENALYSKEDRPLFTSKEIAQLKSNYLTRKNLNENMSKIAYEQEIEMKTTDILKLAVEGNMEGAHSLAVEMLGKYPHEKFIDAITNAQTAAGIIARGGPNYYEVTGSPVLAWDLQKRAENTFEGQDNLTLTDVRPYVGREDGISQSDYDKIKRILNKGPTAKEFEDTAAAKIIVGLIEGMPAIEKEIPESLRDYMKEYASRLLQDSIKKSDPPMTDREKKEEAFRIYLNVKRMFDAGEIELRPEKLPGYVPPMQRKDGYYVKKGLAPGEFKEPTTKMGISQPKTKAEFDKLPSGTIFIAPDGTKRRKP